MNDLPQNVKLTPQILLEIVQHIDNNGMLDVMMGIGILNESFVNCSEGTVQEYYQAAFDDHEGILGPKTLMYIGNCHQVEWQILVKRQSIRMWSHNSS